MPLFKVGNFNQIDVSFVQTAKVVKVEYKNTARFFRSLSIDALLNYHSILNLLTMDLAESSNKFCEV
jgi:hypothetical protein